MGNRNFLMPGTSGNQSSSTSKSSSGNGSSNATSGRDPQLVSGWQYHTYMRDDYGKQRYQYLGKNEGGEPEFIDFGPKKK